YIDGKKYTEDGLDNLEVVSLTINVLEGSVGQVESECDLTINGNVKGNVHSGMSVDIEGNVEGDVRAGMSVDIEGNQTGSVNSDMSATIKNKIYR
ncbi:MAG: polymer-forming cytoskeletal protein, partial [Peptostreptococcaceae bacterium]